MKTRPVSVLIVGAGAIGIYLGTKLFAHGHHVTLLGRKKLRALSETIQINGKRYALPNRVYHFPKNVSFDYVFITSKLYDLTKNIQTIHRNHIRSRRFISIQNGLVNPAVFEPYFKVGQHVSISVFEGFRLKDDVISVSSTKLRWRTEPSALGKATAALLSSSGVRCTADPHIAEVKAEKMLMNCSVNVLSAIEGKTFVELVKNKRLRKKVDALFDENYAVLSSFMKLLPLVRVKKNFYETVRGMNHYSSTYQDATSGRRTEVPFLNSYIVELGKKNNVSTPQNDALLLRFNQKFYSKNKKK